MYVFPYIYIYLYVKETIYYSILLLLLIRLFTSTINIHMITTYIINSNETKLIGNYSFIEIGCFSV